MLLLWLYLLLLTTLYWSINANLKLLKAVDFVVDVDDDVVVFVIVVVNVVVVVKVVVKVVDVALFVGIGPIIFSCG